MGNYSGDTFDASKRYVNVRLQQGVPILDADWNEMDNIRKYELQNFIKPFFSEGVPADDSFLIKAIDASNSTQTVTSNENDFWISVGSSTLDGKAGCCLVNGWEVIITGNINYKGQALYDNSNKADDWKVDKASPLEPLTNKSRQDLVYLDVWEREVDSVEDPDLINDVIGLETCVRIKREWVVRVAEGTTTLPTPSTGHAFYPLALLNRPKGDASIKAAYITDLRKVVSTRNAVTFSGSSYPFQMRKVVEGVVQKSSTTTAKVVADATNYFTIIDEDDIRGKVISIRGIFDKWQGYNASVAELDGSKELCSFGTDGTNPASEVWVVMSKNSKASTGSLYQLQTSMICSYSENNKTVKLTLHLDCDDDGHLLGFIESEEEIVKQADGLNWQYCEAGILIGSQQDLATETSKSTLAGQKLSFGRLVVKLSDAYIQNILAVAGGIHYYLEIAWS